jgi:hypothetical protein
MKWRELEPHLRARVTRVPAGSGPRLLGAAFTMAMAAMTVTCSSTEPKYSEDPCSNNYAHSRYTIIGPQGGEVGFGYYSTPGDMVRLIVPAGAWAECWEVQVEGDFGTPHYPAGFLPSGYRSAGSVGISIYRQTESGERIYAPDSMYVELSFPLLSIPADAQRIIGTFHFDSTAMDWRVRLPDARDADFVTVRVSDWKRPWWFGRVDLQDVDFQRYMAPALEDQVGTATWNRIMAVMDSVYNRAKPSLALTCLGANIVQGLFEALRDNGAAGVRAIQGGVHCGTCDALSTVFWDEWHQYIDLKQTGLFIDLVGNLVPGGGIVKELAGQAISFIYDRLTSGGFACDFECYFDAIPKSWFLYMAEYYAGAGIASLVKDFKTGYLHCPLGASGEGSAAAWVPAGSALGTSAVSLPPCRVAVRSSSSGPGGFDLGMGAAL